jgi:hypothetical protein
MEVVARPDAPSDRASPAQSTQVCGQTVYSVPMDLASFLFGAAVATAVCASSVAAYLLRVVRHDGIPESHEPGRRLAKPIIGK